MGGGIGSLWIIMLFLFAGAGIFVALAKPPEFVAWINDKSDWWDRHYASMKEKEGFIAGTWAAMIWGIHKLHQGTASIDDEAIRAGTRFALFFCVASVSLIVVASLIYLAIVIALLIIGFWILGMVFGDDKKQRDEEYEKEPYQPRRPRAARAGRSRQREDWLGNKYTEHLDEDGSTIGRSEAKKDWLGNPYVETTNADGEVVETSRGRKDWLGNPYVEHRDAEDEKSGESRAEEDWLGNPFVEHRDEDGAESGRSRKKQDWLGNDYVEHEPKE
ncbi:MAG TPA: hypothetical protein VIT45_07785 [Allosphingosinicella sp.]